MYPDMTNDELATFMVQHGIRQVDLAKMVGIDEDKVSKVFKGKRRWQAREWEIIKDWVASRGMPPSSAGHSIKVIGTVEAGVWRERTEWCEDECYQIEVGPAPITGIQRFGLVVEGHSMDKVFSPGTELECLSVPYNGSGLTPQVGDYVIAQRQRGGLFETTCKRLAIDDNGDWELWAESTRPEYKDPIKLGRPDSDHFEDNETRIIGIVHRSYRSHFRRT